MNIQTTNHQEVNLDQNDEENSSGSTGETLGPLNTNLDNKV